MESTDPNLRSSHAGYRPVCVSRQARARLPSCTPSPRPEPRARTPSPEFEPRAPSPSPTPASCAMLAERFINQECSPRFASSMRLPRSGLLDHANCRPLFFSALLAPYLESFLIFSVVGYTLGNLYTLGPSSDEGNFAAV